MAKKQNTDEQLELIELSDEDTKKIQAKIRKRNGVNNDHLELGRKLKEMDADIIEDAKKYGGKPDINGVYRIKIGATILKIKPGTAKLSFEEEDNSPAEEPDEESQAEGEEQGSRRRRVGNA